MSLFYLLLCIWRDRSSRPEEFYKEGVLRNSTHSQDNTCAEAFFAIKLQAEGLQLHYIQNLVQELSCEFCEIFIRISILQMSAMACLWRVRSLLEFLSAFTVNGRDNSFINKELRHILPWKFLNVQIGLFLRIPLSCCFWKYPSRQKHV